MTVFPFPGFKSLSTHHCVTGSMLHIYHFRGHRLSEDMLLGIGSGLGFVYWHPRGAAPMLGGRANVGRPGEEGLEITTGRRTGVRIERHSTGSERKAQAALVAQLEAGEPVMLQVDMGFLPYFDNLPEGFHFGYHVIVAAGYDASTGQVLIADRDPAMHAVSLEDLARARGSTYRPFPPRNTWYTFDFAEMRSPHPEEVHRALSEVCQGMLGAPIANLGVRGIHKAANEVRKWPTRMDGPSLRQACLSAFLFIDAAGGTGGGLFRLMYARFLNEAAGLLSAPALDEAGSALLSAGADWQEVASEFQRASQAADPGEALSGIPPRLAALADKEGAIWASIQEILDGMPAS